MAMTLRLSDDGRNALEAQAAAEGVSMQELARRAIGDYVERSEHRVRVWRAADRTLDAHTEAIERLGR